MKPCPWNRSARQSRTTWVSRGIFAAPRVWAAFLAFGCVGLGVMAQTPARPADPLAPRSSPPSPGSPDAAAPAGASTPSGARPSANPLKRSDTATAYRTETGLPYRPDSEPDVYARERCKLDVYHPVGASAVPAVVWFHGGGLTGGNRSVPSALKGQGITVVAADYRLSPKAKAPAYIEDAAAAVAWTFKNIARYGGDTNRIFLSGHSAGGYLASLVTLDRRWLAVHSVDPDRLAGLVPFSGQSITHFAIREERGMPRTRPLIDDLAPVYHVRKDAPPILLISGDRNHELLGRYEESAYFWRMLKEVGHPSVELLELQGYDHGQMAEPAFPLLLRFLRQHGQ
ncbi:MAG: Lipase 2 [Verrucomicrobiota bacterium]